MTKEYDIEANEAFNLAHEILESLVDSRDGMDSCSYDDGCRQQIDIYYTKLNELNQGQHIPHQHPNLGK